MIPSIHVVSNPIKTFYKLWYVNNEFLDLNFKGKLVDRAKELSSDSRFCGIMDKYKRYQDSFFDNLDKFSGKKGIILDFENLVLKDKFGFVQKQCVDDFFSLSEVAPKFMDLYEGLESHVSDVISDEYVFFRMSLYDFPFVLSSDKIENPLKENLSEINSYMSSLDKSGFNNGVRLRESYGVDESYKFSIVSFSEKKFNSMFRSKSGQLGLEKMLAEYDSEISLDEFVDINKKAIRMNREIMRKKYSLLDENLSESYLYMTQGSVGREILKGNVIGEKLLQNTKNLPSLNVIEPQALNRLSGWFSAKYKSKPFIVKKEEFSNTIDVEESRDFPGIFSLNSDLTSSAINFDITDLYNDMKNYNFGVYGIELLTLRLNFENFRVFSDSGDLEWLSEKSFIVEPYDLTEISRDYSGRIIRPSNIGVKCDFNKYLNMLGFDTENRFSRSGNSLHSISNEIDDRQHELLDKYGIVGLERKKYCEVPLVNSFEPSFEEYDAVFEKANRYEGVFRDRLVDKVKSMQDSGVVIIDGGKTDGMLRMGDVPIVIDFKRRMSSYYPVNYFFKQASRYGMALGVDEFYTVIVQTPYSANKFLDRTLDDFGEYRKQKLKIRKVKMDSDFIFELKRDVILEYAGNRVFYDDNSLGLGFRGDHCLTCFSRESCDKILFD